MPNLILLEIRPERDQRPEIRDLENAGSLRPADSGSGISVDSKYDRP